MNKVLVEGEVKSPLHNDSFKELNGQTINTNDYDEYLMGGIKSFTIDPFFRHIIGRRKLVKQIEKEMKIGRTNYACQGSDTGIIHIVKWDKERRCFLVWKHLLKDSIQNLVMKNGGMNISTHMGHGFDSIANKNIHNSL